MINYHDLLCRLGVAVAQRQNQTGLDGTKGALNWEQIEQRRAEAQQRKQQPKVDPAAIAGMGIHQLEVEFRKKMRENYVNLKKIFMVLDKNLDGFVSIDDLKSVLNRFTIPMSDQLFAQLMERFEFKASGKVPWEHFLEKFQDAQSWGNGQTIPIKPAHKYFPLRGDNEKMSLRELIRHLDQHVKSAYNSFKEAFLQIDKNRDGKISRKELRAVLESFKFRTTPDQFRELMIILDPQHTNFIDYHRFLDLFEEKETREGHKWLNSVHRVNENTAPAVLAWETVEGILRDKLTENWRAVADAIVSHDPQAEGRIPAKQLRKVIERFALPLSDEHFKSMLESLEDSQGDRVNYHEFMVKLGVDVRPGDLEGVSTQIQAGSEQSEAQRLQDLAARGARMEQRAEERTGGMSPEEVISRLKDRMAQHDNKIRHSFHYYDRSGKGRISKKDFRKVLESSGIYMTAEQFKELCNQLSFHNGHMTYTDFLVNFEDPRAGGPSDDLIKSPNHKVNEIRGQDFGMTAVEAEAKLRKKLRENFADLRGAFYKFDDDHNGILTKKNFRRMLDAFHCVMSDEEYEKLCQRLEIDKKSRISYKDFLEKFEVKDSLEEGHKWLNSVHRYNSMQPVQPMTAEQVHAALVEKAHRQYNDLAQAFCTIDRKGKNVVTRRELRDVLYRFILPVTKEEFNKLWAMYDCDSKGYISYEVFLEKLTAETFAPGDQQGTSEQIVGNSYKQLEEHHRSQQAKHEQITLNQAVLATDFSVDNLLQQLKDRIRDQYKDFYTAFRKYDTHKRGYLTTIEIQKVLVDFNYFLDDDQFFDLLDRLGLHSRRNKLYYEDFLKVFEEGRKDGYKPRQGQVKVVAHEGLGAEEAVNKLMVQAEAQADVLENAFGAFDKTESGSISMPDFRRILDHFCFKLTNPQFRQLMSRLGSRPDGRVDYQAFLDSVKQTDPEDPDGWLDTVRKRLQNTTPQALPMDEVHELLAQMVTARFYHIARAFAEIDYAKIGVVSKDDFRQILNKYTIRLSDKQFSKLWSCLKVNEFDNLDYKDFLKMYTLEAGLAAELGPATGRGSVAKRPQTADSNMGRNSRAADYRSGSKMSRPFTPMVNAEGVEKHLAEKVRRHWREIQKQCRAFDTEDRGEILHSDFRFILGRHKIYLSEDDLDKLLTKYEIHRPGYFCYTEFIRHFVLDMDQREDSLMARKKLHKARVPTSTGERTDALEDAMLRVRRCILNSWKEMRREFRSFDRPGVGVVTPSQFRQVLKNHKVDLTEEEFFHCMTHYDHDLSGNVSYNDFIGAFLKSA